MIVDVHRVEPGKEVEGETSFKAELHAHVMRGPESTRRLEARTWWEKLTGNEDCLKTNPMRKTT